MVGRSGLAKGRKEGWSISVRPFKVTNGQAQVAAIQRLEKLNKLVVGYDLPTREQWQARQTAVTDSGYTVQAGANIEHYQQMAAYCDERMRANLQSWQQAEDLKETKEENLSLKARLEEAEKLLAQQKKSSKKKEAPKPDKAEESNGDE